jgi:hypothetical protein
MGARAREHDVSESFWVVDALGVFTQPRPIAAAYFIDIYLDDVCFRPLSITCYLAPGVLGQRRTTRSSRGLIDGDPFASCVQCPFELDLTARLPLLSDGVRLDDPHSADSDIDKETNHRSLQEEEMGPRWSENASLQPFVR